MIDEEGPPKKSDLSVFTSGGDLRDVWRRIRQPKTAEPVGFIPQQSETISRSTVPGSARSNQIQVSVRYGIEETVGKNGY